MISVPWTLTLAGYVRFRIRPMMLAWVLMCLVEGIVVSVNVIGPFS